jgi:hypothetical protein
MSGLTTGISGAIGLVLISGAAQFALGRDLSPTSGRLSPANRPLFLSSNSYVAADTAVNRGAKADRATGPAGSPALTRTVSLKLNDFLDTTFLLRVPVVAAVRAPSVASSPTKPVARKPMVACEAMVSVLTDVAKQLQPGRCVA